MKLLFVICLTSLMAVSLAAGPNEVVRVDRDNDAHALLTRADSVFQTRDYAAALKLYRDAFEQAEKEFNPSVAVEASAQVARMYLLLDDKETGRRWLADAAERANTADPHGWSRFLSVKARYEWKDDALPEARKTLEQMFEYSHANALYGRAVDAANLLGIVSETTEEQKQWIEQGIGAAEGSGEERWLGPLWNNLAGIYYDDEQYDSAVTAYLSAREYHWRHSNETAKLYADYHVGMAYAKVGNLEEAKTWLRPVLAWAERLDNASAIAQACEDLGEIALAQGDEDGGKKLLERALANYREAGLDEAWPKMYDRLVKRVESLQ